VTMPTRTPWSSTTGRRFTWRSSMSAAATSTRRVPVTVTAGEVIASPAVVAARFAAVPFVRWRNRWSASGWGSRRSFTMMSASLTTPTTCFSSSTTGAPEIPRLASISATCFREVSGATVRTSVVMTSATLMALSPSIIRCLDRRSGPGGGASVGALQASRKTRKPDQRRRRCRSGPQDGRSVHGGAWIRRRQSPFAFGPSQWAPPHIRASRSSGASTTRRRPVLRAPLVSAAKPRFPGRERCPWRVWSCAAPGARSRLRAAGRLPHSRRAGRSRPAALGFVTRSWFASASAGGRP